ncbi:hypothetical protein DIPPA_32952 [Diplonema papillatum]|nr:hypothetical protein DIPPA_32952 [Diplonema papillatum]
MPAPYKIAESEALGRHMLASRGVRKGTKLMAETPVVALRSRRSSGQPESCDGCGVVIGDLAALARIACNGMLNACASGGEGETQTPGGASAHDVDRTGCMSKCDAAQQYSEAKPVHPENKLADPSACASAARGGSPTIFVPVASASMGSLQGKLADPSACTSAAHGGSPTGSKDPNACVPVTCAALGGQEGEPADPSACTPASRRSSPSGSKGGGSPDFVDELVRLLKPWRPRFDVASLPCSNAACCGSLFCSELCRERHEASSLCPGALPTAGQREARAEYDDLFRVNERFAFLLKHFTTFPSVSAVRDSVASYDDGGLVIPVTRELRSVLKRASSLISSTINPSPLGATSSSAADNNRVSSQDILRLLNVYNVNCHTTCYLSPLFTLRKHLSVITGIQGLPDTKRLEAMLDIVFAASDPGNVHVTGTGLFKDAACMNHSCQPTCRVVPSVGPKLEVVALRDVAEGEALTISYVDAERWRRRPVSRRALLRAYNFSCSCPSCVAEWSLHSAAWTAAALLVTAASTAGR